MSWGSEYVKAIKYSYVRLGLEKLDPNFTNKVSRITRSGLTSFLKITETKSLIFKKDTFTLQDQTMFYLGLIKLFKYLF